MRFAQLKQQVFPVGGRGGPAGLHMGGMPHVLSSRARAGLSSEHPFTSLGATMGKERARPSFQKTTPEGKPLGTQAVMAGGLWVVVLVLSVFPVFNAGVSVSARNLPSEMWGLSLKLSCFLGLSAEPPGLPTASTARLLDFRSQH